ncbi:MAG: hypothetical protein E7314_06720 [Clostridiales bacterium]|nr:hypothetical protein [Clostridiales bacterium]
MATLRKSRSGIITSKTGEYVNKDIKDSEHYIGKLNAELVKTYEDEHLLTEKVEVFLDEVASSLTNTVTHFIIENRGRERDAAIANSRFETQDKEFEKNIDENFRKVGEVLTKLSARVEIADRIDNILKDCKNGISGCYKINSKKMVDELEKAIKEYVENKTAPSNCGGR